MTKKPWYIELFENYAKTYDKELFTQGTKQEVGFIEKEIGFNKKIEILDVGCGTGRHSIELAKRGYHVTGFDISKDQLKAARAKAKNEKLKINFVQKDARNFKFRQKFDLAIMLCEGGFSLMETDQENFDILLNVARVLNPGGKFIFTTLNALYPVFNNLKKFHDENLVSGNYLSSSFNVLTLRDKNIFEIPDDDGNMKKLECNERYYMPSEISWMLQTLHFENIEIWGGEIGNFSRKKLTEKHFEMLVVSTKKAG